MRLPSLQFHNLTVLSVSLPEAIIVIIILQSYKYHNFTLLSLPKAMTVPSRLNAIFEHINLLAFMVSIILPFLEFHTLMIEERNPEEAIVVPSGLNVTLSIEL